MSEPLRTAAELFTESLRLLLAKDMLGYAGLWAADGIIEFPFAAADYPKKLAGRAAIEDYLRGYPDLLDVREIAAQTVHRTENPDVVLAEFEAIGVVMATGKPYRMSYVAVLTARAGEIVSYRDYWSPLAAAEIMGGPAELTAAFTGSGGRHE
ncbi:nuclear transport factor 2 family protein [Nocardia alni]|uniref:nuclear transport factor 2 family protein n=1 Tax=Nocardia alni TaxID=2815723 RepID=UPI001C25014C|nr:nuclear transport factor 2 family protein [Nocardia alni]